MASYTYVLSVDFTASNVDLAAFQTTIAGSSISSSTIQYLIRSGTSVSIFFSGTLSGPDITTLNGLVSAYVYSAPTSLVYVDTTTLQQIGSKQLYTSNTIIDATVSSKVLGFSLSGMSTSTQLTLASTISANRIYTFPDAGVNANVLLTNSSGTQTIASGNLTLSGTSAVLALSGTTSALTVAGTTTSTSATTGSVLLSGGLGINTATAASSATNGGSITTAGGIGVALASFFGANLTLSGTSAVLALSGTTSALTVAGTTTSTSATTGSVLLSGGLGINTATAASSSSNGGSITTAGGIGVALASFFGANLTLSGTSAILALSGASSSITVAGTTTSTSATTGSVLLSGGLGINTATAASSSSNGGSITTAGGIGVALASFFGANLTLSGTSAVLALSGASSTLTLANTAASTSSSTGSLQISGGAYFGAGSLFNALTTFRGAGSTTLSAATIYINPATTALTGASAYFFTYLAAPITTASTFTGSASTLYIAGPPTVTTGGTGISLNVAAGTVRVGGTLQIPTGATNGYILTSDATGNASWAAGSAPTISYFNAVSNGTFSTNATIQANITTMTLTPTTAGTYWLSFTASFRVQVSNTTATFDLALNGTAITNTSNVFFQNAQLNTYTVVINVIQAFNGSTDVVTARVSSNSSSSSIILTYRSIYALRMSA